jgi:hypothetical protein
MLASPGRPFRTKSPAQEGTRRRSAAWGAGRIGARLGPNWAPLFLFLDCCMTTARGWNFQVRSGFLARRRDRYEPETLPPLRGKAHDSGLHLRPGRHSRS